MSTGALVAEVAEPVPEPVPDAPGGVLGTGLTGTVVDGVAGIGEGADVGRRAIHAPTAMTATAAAAAIGGSHERRRAAVGDTAARMSPSRPRG